MKKIARFLREEDGPTTVEYAMIILLVFLACLTAITAIGQATTGSHQGASHSVDAAVTTN